MQETPNYNLKKIELADSPPDITIINPNWDRIDQEMKANADAAAGAQSTVDNLTPEDIGAVDVSDFTSDKITIIPSIPNANASGDNIPNGVTMFVVSTGSTGYFYPYSTIVNFKINNTRFTQWCFKNGDTEDGAAYRHWYTGKGWSKWIEILDKEEFDIHKDDTWAHGATHEALPNTIMRRQLQGNLSVADATGGSHAVNRNYADGRYARPNVSNTFNQNQKISKSIALLIIQALNTSGAMSGVQLNDADDERRWVAGLSPSGGSYGIYDHLAGHSALSIEPGADGRMFVRGNESWHNGNNPVSAGFNGYQRLANGLILQWGQVINPDPGSSFNATFPIAFPNTCYGVYPSMEVGLVNPQMEGGDVWCTNRTNSSASFKHTFEQYAGSRNLRYFAIGR